MWNTDDSFVSVGAPNTASDALALIEAFLAEHRKRIVRQAPILRPRNLV